MLFTSTDFCFVHCSARIQCTIRNGAITIYIRGLYGSFCSGQPLTCDVRASNYSFVATYNAWLSSVATVFQEIFDIHSNFIQSGQEKRKPPEEKSQYTLPTNKKEIVSTLLFPFFYDSRTILSRTSRSNAWNWWYVNTREPRWNHLKWKEVFFLRQRSIRSYFAFLFSHRITFPHLPPIACDANTWECNEWKLRWIYQAYWMTLFGASINHLIS